MEQMGVSLAARFTDDFARWLTSEGFWISQNRDSAYASIIDLSGCRWVISVRATALNWTLVVVFDPAGDHEELFYDLDGEPKYVTKLLVNQLAEVWDDSPSV